jgi:uncharacterized RDD family membrane protein YckC
MTSPSAGLARRYAAWSLDAAVVGAVALLVTASRIRAASGALAAAFHDVSNRMTDQLGAAMAQGGDPTALATQLLGDPGIHAGSDAVQAALTALLVPPLVAYALLGLLYHVGSQTSHWQASPGQRALGLAVTRSDGTPATLPQLAWRYLASALSWLTLNLGHALALAPPHRTLHDLLSGTAVVQAPGATRMPAWAKAWLVVQAAAVVLATAWAVLRYLAMLQAALGV